MSNDLIRWLIAVAVFAHGAGHVLFMPVLAPVLRIDASGHSWLLTAPLGDGPTRALASLAGAAALALFVGAGAALVLQTGWWRPLALAGAVVSVILVATMWDGLPSSSALLALVFDVFVLGAVVVARWPTSEIVGG
jgi:hypothetical protein